MNSKTILRKATRALIDYPNSVVVTWLPKYDSIAHAYGPSSEVARHEMKATSKAIGELCKKLNRQGLYEDLEILIIPDHGQREIKKSRSEKVFSSTRFRYFCEPCIFITWNYSANKRGLICAGLFKWI